MVSYQIIQKSGIWFLWLRIETTHFGFFKFHPFETTITISDAFDNVGMKLKRYHNLLHKELRSLWRISLKINVNKKPSCAECQSTAGCLEVPLFDENGRKINEWAP